MCGYVPGLTGPADATSGGDVLIAPAEVLNGAPAERELEVERVNGQALLAIDTALGSSVALAVDGRVYEVSSDDLRGHAEAIGGLMSRVFELANIKPHRVTGVVAGVGPGPFTGLRIGMSAAHAFATGLQVPLFSLQSHEAVAFAAFQQQPARSVRVVQDAKRRELFVTEFSGLDTVGLPVRSADPRLELRETFVDEPGDIWPDRVPAARLAQLAIRRLAAGRSFEAPQALYLRAPDAKPAAAVKRVSA